MMHVVWEIGTCSVSTQMAVRKTAAGETWQVYK